MVHDHPVPPLRADTMLIETKAVALNPHDWRGVDWFDVSGCTVGTDFSGVVVEISQGTVARQFKVGDRVAGTSHGSTTPPLVSTSVLV